MYHDTKLSKLCSKNLFSSFRRSEFLGCLMIPVNVVMHKCIRGSFLLQPQISLSNPSALIPELSERLLNSKEKREMF